MCLHASNPVAYADMEGGAHPPPTKFSQQGHRSTEAGGRIGQKPQPGVDGVRDRDRLVRVRILESRAVTYERSQPCPLERTSHEGAIHNGAAGGKPVLGTKSLEKP